MSSLSCDASIIYYYSLEWLSRDNLSNPPFALVTYSSVLPRNFITGDNVPGLLKKWGHLTKKWGHCGENDGPVIWRSKISLLSVYIITDHTLTVNK